MELLSAILTPELAVAAAVAVLAAAMRGLTGFGANLIWGPALALLYGPVEMVAIMGLTGLVGTVHLCLPAIRHADWHEMTPIIVGSLVTVPFGVWSLLALEPDLVRRAIGGFILVIALIFLTGWRYEGERRGPAGLAARLVAGGGGGWLAGFAGIGGPILVLYFLAAPGTATVQRANNAIGVSALSPLAVVLLAFEGSIGLDTVLRSAILVVPYLLGQEIGARLFRLVPADRFRRLVLGLLIVIGLGVLVA